MIKKFKGMGYSTIALILLLLGVAIIFVFYNDINRTIEHSENELERIRTLQWSDIEDSIKVSNIKASESSSEVANRIRARLLNEYNLELLAQDMKDPEQDDLFLKIFSEEIVGKYIYKDNGKNDLFVASPNGIYVDGTSNKTIDNNSNERKWDIEKFNHYNSDLAESAINSMVSGNRDFIFWEYNEHVNHDHIKLKEMTLQGLKEVFLKEGMDGIYNYEVLNVSYIDETYDLFGNPDVTILGKNETQQILVVQTYSIYDSLDTDENKKLFDLYEDKEKEIIDNTNKEVNFKKVHLVLLSLLLLMSFIGIVLVQNRAIARNACPKEEEEREL